MRKIMVFVAVAGLAMGTLSLGQAAAKSEPVDAYQSASVSVTPSNALGRCMQLARKYGTACDGEPKRVGSICFQDQNMRFGYAGKGMRTRTVVCDSPGFRGKWIVVPAWM